MSCGFVACSMVMDGRVFQINSLRNFEVHVRVNMDKPEN